MAFKIQCNVGKTERIIRTAIGLAVLGLGLAYNTWFGLIGLIPLTTAVFGWCPVSALLGISTCKDAKSTLPDTSISDSPKPLRMREMDKDKKS